MCYKYILIISVILLIFSCKKQSKKIEYYEDGSVQKIYYRKDSQTNGEFREYYKNGVLKVEGHYEHGKAHGTFSTYSIDGDLIKKGNYINDNAIGWFDYYRNGKLVRKRQYVLVNNKSYLNQYIKFDKFGDIIKDSSNYISLKKLDSKKYNLCLEAPVFSEEYMEIVIGNFTDKFNIIDPSTLDTLKVNGELKISLELKKSQKAIICDLQEYDNMRKVRYIYFDPRSYEYQDYSN